MEPATSAVDKAYQVYNTSIKKPFEMQDYLLGHFEEARWQEPGKPALKASRFIPVLERSSLVYQLDLHVLDHVCQLLNQRRADNLPTIPVSINLSPSDFNIDSFIDQVLGITQKYQIPHNMIQFDLLAQPVAVDQQRLKDAAANLWKQGFRICLDRYGGEKQRLVNGNPAGIQFRLS